MKQIQLTKGYLTEVDDDDFIYLNTLKWAINRYNDRVYAVTRINKKQVYMHRLIMGAKHGEKVDHRKGNGLNNQRSNLRICTHSQNMANRRARKNGSSKYLGVSLCKNSGKNKLWEVEVRKDGIRYRLGRYKNEIEAAIAYNTKASEVHGEFANLNIIP